METDGQEIDDNAMEPTTREFTVPPEGIDRIDTWLAGCAEGFSRSRVQGLIKAGMVTLNGSVLARPTEKAHPGDKVVMSVPPPVPAIPEPEDIPLSIIYEDGHLLVVDKPAGLVVHPAPGHFTGTLVNAVLHHCPGLSGIGGVARPGIVHRLDQDTSGVMVVAKSEQAMAQLVKAFSNHAPRGFDNAKAHGPFVRKTYLALVHGVPKPLQGRIENLIGRSPFDRKKMAIVERNGKVAVTNWKTLETKALKGGAKVSLVECEIETGRTHQIRVHMASLGCPVVGDRSYGKPAWDKRLPHPPMRQLLHAARLELRHPVAGKTMTFESPLPDDFGCVLND